MTNHIKFECSTLANEAVLSIEPGPADYRSAASASEAGERFLRSATLLPADGFLGWQIAADKDQNISSFLFSSPGLKVTTEDFNWIFQKCATADMSHSGAPENLYEESRKVYMLSSVSGSFKDINIPEASERRKPQYDDYDYGYNYSDPLADSYFKDMFEMLAEGGAVIRIIAGPAVRSSAGHGMIFISLPDEMPLRIQSALSLAFPHLMAEEVVRTLEADEDAAYLPDDLFMDGVAKFLYTLMCRTESDDLGKNGGIPDSDAGYEMDDEDISDFEEIDDEYDDDGSEGKGGTFTPLKDLDSTPLEDLELSIRSYNCLRRAGIDTVGKLRAMSDEDLSHVRNLGKKSMEEIKRKLAEIQALEKGVPLRAASYMDMLNELIGLEDVKAQIKKITAFAKMKRDMSENGKSSLPVALNMEFVGNPGTAKTTVARITAGIFHEIGLLANNELIEVGRADLVAKYVGQTAEKVKEVFRRAKGKLLFIDEAYSLLESREGDFGDEAINTIVQEMENNRGNTIVIFAGYPNKMEKFFARNPGLRSRVPFSIRFQDYSADDMLEIAGHEARTRGFAIHAQAKEKVLSICSQAAGKPDMGNGRFCRNLVENAILSYASRVYGSDEESANRDFELAEEDFTAPSTLQKAEKLKSIGFRYPS